MCNFFLGQIKRINPFARIFGGRLFIGGVFLFLAPKVGDSSNWVALAVCIQVGNDLNIRFSLDE